MAGRAFPLGATVVEVNALTDTALPDLDANSSVTVIQAITLQHEGWERDSSVPKPAKNKKT